MDPFAWVLSVVAGSLAVAYIARVVAGTVIRLREIQAAKEPALLAARLDRIEAAVEAIAIEVERAGELQRFSAKLQSSTLPPPAAVSARSVTPH